MDKSSLKRIGKSFFDKNYSIILDNRTNISKIDEILLTYFGKKLRKKIHNKDVAYGLIEYLYEKGIVNDQEKLDSLCLESLFLKKNIKLPLNRIASNILKSNPISSDEIKAIESRKALEYIKTQKRKEIEDDLKEIKEQKEALLKSLPSIFDKESFFEPKKEIDEYRNKEVWWQKLNLICDPFPTQDGLSKIDETMYEEVVTKTKSFESIIDLFEQDPKLFFNKGTLLCGGFGSGKTTIIDYLSYFTKQNYNYVSVTITFEEQRNVVDYIQRFKLELLKALKKISNQFDIETNSYTPDLDTDIPYLILQLKDNGINGIIIYIDDLHKHTNKDLVFDFFSQMQIIKKKFIQEGLNVGFIVSGSKIWKRGLLSDRRLTGFFDNATIEIEDPNSETVYNVISRRLNAFRYDKTKSLSIDKDYIERIFNRAKEEGVKSGYRGFINIVIDQLRSGSTEVFEIDPIFIEKEKKEKIKAMLESNNLLYPKFNSFLYKIKMCSPENRKRGMRVLSLIFLKSGVQEEDDFFKNNAFFFNLLNDAQLIQRSKTLENKLRWVIDNNLIEWNKEVRKRFGCSLEDYLEAIFFSDEFKYKGGLNTIEDEKIRQIQLFQDTLKGNVETFTFDQFKKSFEIYKEVLVKFNLKSLQRSSYLLFIEKCKESIRALSTTIFEIEGSSAELKLKHYSEAWSLHWGGMPEPLIEFITETENIDNIEEEKIAIIRNKFLSAFDSLYEFLVSCLSFSVLNKNKKYLNRDEIKLLNDVYYDLTHKYTLNINFDLVKRLNDFMEVKLRNSLFNFSTILFGEKYSNRMKNYPSSIRKYMELNKKDMSDRYNEFECLNRGQYKEINQTKDTAFSTLIWGKVFDDFNLNDKNFLIENFCDFNLKTSHNKTSSIESSDYHIIDTYIKLCIELLKSINKFYINIISCHYYFFKNSNLSVITPSFKGNSVENQILEKDFPYFNDLNKYRLDENGLSRLINMFNSEDSLSLNVDNSYEVSVILSNKYLNCIFNIANLIQNKLISVEVLYGTEIILHK